MRGSAQLGSGAVSLPCVRLRVGVQMVQHTIFHWQSLFATLSNPLRIDNYFEQSFEALVPASAMWWEGSA